MEDKELAPVFSPFLRRLDPMLGAEDVNPIFLAFRLRREVHGNQTFLSHWKRTLIPVSGGISFTMVLVGIIFFESRVLVFPFNLVIVALVAGWIASLFASTKSNTGGVPKFTSKIFGLRTSSSKQILFDLYMVGATGRDFAEAIYLENRLKAMSVAVWTVIFGVGLQVVFYVILSHAFAKFTSPGLTVVFTLLLVWQCFEIFDAAGKGHRMQAVRLAKAQATLEKASLRLEPVSDIIKKQFLNFFIQVSVAVTTLVGIFIIAFPAIVVMSSLFAFLQDHRRTSPLSDYVATHAALLIYLGLIATALLLRTLTRKFFDARMEKKLMNDFAETSDLFGAVLRAHASEDQEMKEYLWAEFKAREAARKQSRSSPVDSAPAPPTDAMAS